MNWLSVDKYIKEALLEDSPYGDVTTEAIVSSNSRATVDLIAKEEGVIAGIDVFKRVFYILGGTEVELYIEDGQKVQVGQIIGKVTGNTGSVLTGERVALNYLQRMSGIATLTNKFVTKLNEANSVYGSHTRLLDTRKTTPNMRIFEKYAVKVGGGCNHRFNLSDGVLIKDNHIAAAGGIKEAITLLKEKSPFVRKIEVETETMEQVKQAIDAGADIIMLDNMNVATMKEAVELIGGRAETEASGNVTLDTIEKIASTGVDYISTGAVTHSFKVLDLSMKNLVNIG